MVVKVIERGLEQFNKETHTTIRRREERSVLHQSRSGNFMLPDLAEMPGTPTGSLTRELRVSACSAASGEPRANAGGRGYGA